MKSSSRRPEDYEAMAERARRAEAELEQLKLTKRSEFKISSRLIRSMKIALLVVWAASGIFVLFTLGFKWVLNRLDRPVVPVCYTTGHTDAHNRPWDPYHVFKHDPGDDKTGYAITDDLDVSIKFNSRAEADAFVVKYNLPACRFTK